MRNFTWLFGLLSFVLFMVGCAEDQATQPQISLEYRYRCAIEDAVFAETSEICDQLTAITPENTMLSWSSNDSLILVVSWTQYPDSYPVGDTVDCWWGDTWATVVPDLENWLQHHEINPDSPMLRLQQLLGLPPDSNHSHFVEFWVSPDDLFRPTPDPEITDCIAQLDFPASVSQEYIAWFNNNIIGSYFPLQYPWTRLGYTYDWGSENTEIGLSEFVVRKSSDVIVEQMYTTQEYIMQVLQK